MDHVSWTSMADGTREDYEFLGSLFMSHAKGELVDNLVGLMALMKGPKLGYQIDRYQHSLQSATRALRADEDIDLVVGALLHDIGDPIAPENHSAMAASLLQPYVDDETHWVIRHHGLFQGYYYFHHLGGDRNARDLFADHPHFEACVAFCEKYDQNCFDPDYDTLPIDDFVPLMQEVFDRPSRLPGVAPIGMGVDDPLV
jgi:predicted HD phosphohydrolase